MQKTTTRGRRALGVLATTLVAGGLFAAQAGAHATIGPSVVQVGSSNAYTLMVPTEEEGLTTTEVTMEVPDGFNMGGFEAIPGVKRTVESEGSGEDTVVHSVTWTGLKVPLGDSAFLRFSGYVSDDKEHNFTFKVHQTYSDGKVVDWVAGPEADEPAPTISMVKASAGGGEEGDDDGTDTLTIVALIIGGLALLLGLAGLARRGDRDLT
jgi:uncharacterized protein YcnI